MSAILRDVIQGMSMSHANVNNDTSEEISFGSNESGSENLLEENLLAVERSSGTQHYRFKLERSSSNKNGVSSD